MSNARSIAAVTATLRSLLEKQVPKVVAGLDGLLVTAGPPDFAGKDSEKAQINLFLYQVVANAALSNQDLPFQVRPGEMAPPPLALNLHFLMTVYAKGDVDAAKPGSHSLLGAAMSVLHSHPLLGREELKGVLPGTDLDRQFERVRITALPMGIDELSKLWTTFQTPYRLSAAYEATVVLIDSRRSAPAPLPVLKRGDADRGPAATARLAPLLDSVEFPHGQGAARLGEAIALAGAQLGAADKAVFRAPHFAKDLVLVPDGMDDDGALLVVIAEATGDPESPRWSPGFFTVAVRRDALDDLPSISSNALPLAIAPTIEVTLDMVTAGTVSLTITCTPRIRDGQNVQLIFGDRQVAPGSSTNPADESKPTKLTFTVPGVAKGNYVVRLRVDGVDSIPVVRSGTPPVPSFDEDQMVIVP
jgi:hypothetical protein